MASTRSSLRDSALQIVRAICDTSSVWVMPRAIVVPGRQKEDLCLVFEPSERLAVSYPVPVMLEGRPYVAFRLQTEPFRA